MKMHSTLRFLCISVVLVQSTVAFEVSAEESGKKLSLEQFLQDAAKNDPVFREILIDRLALQYEADLRLPPRDLVLDVEQAYELELSSGKGNVDTLISLSKLFPESGIRTTAEYAVSEFRDSRKRTSDLSFSIGMPVAENAFGKATRLRKKIIGLEVEVARYQIVEAYEDYFALLASAYISWHEAWEALEVGESSFEKNRRLLDEIQKRARKQIALPIDVNKVQLQVLAKEEALLELREQYRTASYVIGKSLGLDGSLSFSPVSPLAYDGTLTTFDSEYEPFEKEGANFCSVRAPREKQRAAGRQRGR